MIKTIFKWLGVLILGDRVLILLVFIVSIDFLGIHPLIFFLGLKKSLGYWRCITLTHPHSQQNMYVIIMFMISTRVELTRGYLHKSGYWVNVLSLQEEI